MVNKARFTKSDIIRAIRGNPDGNAPAPPKDKDGVVDWIAATWIDDERKSSYGHIPTIAARLSCSDQTIRNYASDRERLPEYKMLNGILKQVRAAVKETDAVVYTLIKEMVAINQEKKIGLTGIIEQLLNGLDNPVVKLNPILVEIKNKIAANTWGAFTKQAVEIQEAIEHERQLGLIKRSDIQHELKTKAEIALLTNIEMLDVNAAKFVLERLDKPNYAARSEVTGADGVALYDDKGQAALAELMTLLESVGQNPNETIVELARRTKAKIEMMKNKGKDENVGDNNTHTTERGE